jgi:hypothetical protein
LGLVGKCGAADFLAAAEPEFSRDLKDRIGGALYDGEPIASSTSSSMWCGTQSGR